MKKPAIVNKKLGLRPLTVRHLSLVDGAGEFPRPTAKPSDCTISCATRGAGCQTQTQ